MTTEGYTRLHWLRGASTAKMIARKKREIRTLYGNEVVKDFFVGHVQIPTSRFIAG